MSSGRSRPMSSSTCSRTCRRRADAYTGEKWLRSIADAVGWKGRVVTAPPERLPDSLRFEANFEHDYILDSTRVRAELGYAELVDERTALRRTIAWERDNSPAGLELDYEAEDAVLASVA